MFPPEETREDMSKRGLLCSFFSSIIYDYQKKIREESHVHKLHIAVIELALVATTLVSDQL